MTDRRPWLSQHSMIDTAPMPEHIPKVEEIGATSAPLLSASFFIGARCKSYGDDFMQCKTESGKGELDCLKEGRRVTRCASSVLADINASCLEEFREHWQCLESYNHQLYQCRIPERRLNKCVFTKLGMEKTIPDTPKDAVPVHLRQRQIYSTWPQDDREGSWLHQMAYKASHFGMNKEEFTKWEAEKDQAKAASKSS